MLSRGQRLDWFESTEIMLEAFIAALAFYLFIAHSVTARAPFLSPRLVKDRNYAIGAFLIVIFGMLNFTPMVLLPSLLQNQLGFPDGLIGYVVSWRGMGVMCGFFSAMVTTRLDVRVGMVVGFGTQIVSGIWLTSIDFNVSLFTLCANAFMQGLAVGLIWTPIATSAFWTLDPSLRADGVAVFHLMRNIGSSFFISISVAEVVRATGANYSRMTEFVTPYNRTLQLPTVMGSWTIDSLSGLAGLSREINKQAALIGYLNAFWMYTAVSAMAIPLVFMVRRPRGDLAAAFERHLGGLDVHEQHVGVERQARHVADGRTAVLHVEHRLGRDLAVGLHHAGLHAPAHGRVGVADVELAAGDVVLAPVERRALGEPGDGVLRGGVGHRVGPGRVRRDRAVVDDAAALGRLRLHDLDGLLRAQERARQDGVHHRPATAARSGLPSARRARRSRRC